MAKRLPQEFYRLNTLPDYVVDFLIQSSGGGDRAYLSQVEETGKLPSGEPLENLKIGGRTPTKLISRNEAIRKFLQTIPTNESSTIEQLEAKQKAYQDLGGEQVTEPGAIDRGALKQHITKFVNDSVPRLGIEGVDAGGLQNAIEFATSSLASGKPFDVPMFAEILRSSTPGGERRGDYGALGQDILNTYMPIISDPKGGFRTKVTRDIAPEVEADISAIQSILQPKLGKRAGEQKIQDYLATLPGESERDIQKFERALGESRGEFFEQELTPRIIRSLSARGALHSGDLESSLAQEGGRLQREVRDIGSGLRMQSQQDVSGKRYENLLRQSLEATGDVQSAIEFARRMSQQDKAMQFQSSESLADRLSKEGISRQEMSIALALGKQPQKEKPSGWDYFLNYGLPALTTIGVAGYGGYQQGKQNKIFTNYLSNKNKYRDEDY